uniref:Cadherin domain-containing protein n=1 Tax=Macrostomum lignano TaxID=282301 RepID=A0A1I8FXB7_9PLAT
ASSNDEQEGVFASDPEALKYIKFGPKPGAKASGASSNDEQEGIFASDPEALKYIKFGPKPGAKASGVLSIGEQEGIFASDPEALKLIKFGPKDGASNNDEQEGVFASDPEALKYIKFGPKPGAKVGGASSNDEQEGVFASDPEALKYIKFGPKPGTSSNDEPEGIFASDPEALKYIKFGPKPEAKATGASSNDKQEGIFASDPEDLKYFKLSPEPAKQEENPPKDQKVVEFGTEAQSATLEEGEFVAEATGVQLKDEKTYTVRVTGHDLPNGQQKKFISVRSADGSGGLTPQEVDNLDVKVETCVGEDGMVEKFVIDKNMNMLALTILIVGSSCTSASIVGLADYDRLDACPLDDLPVDGVRKLDPHQLPDRSIAGCVLSCHTTESCAAASMVAEHRWCLLATAEAFLTAWLHGHGQCDSFVNRRRLAKFQQAHTTDLPSSIAVSSLRILYHFRVGSFNLAPVHRNPHTPVLVSAVLNRSAGAFVTGESGSFIGVSTADGIEDLFVPKPNVTVFMRAKFDFNGE